MKQLALLLLPLALLLNGCSSTSTAAQTAANATWQAVLTGGAGTASGLSFNTQFTVNSDGSLNVESFQFLTDGTCFPTAGGGESGTLVLTVDPTSEQVTGPFTYVVNGNGNTLSLTGNVTGTESGSTLTNPSITGTWTLTGGTGCSDSTGGSFTMTEPTTTTTNTKT